VNETLQRLEVRPLGSSSDPNNLSSQSTTSNLLDHVDFVIADVTDGSPDTFYILGIADALRKPTLMMAQEQVRLPADLASQRLILYRVEDTAKLADFVRYWITDYRALQQQGDSFLKRA
jgi:nucleoside 2-deoxyribosyltransferase